MCSYLIVVEDDVKKWEWLYLMLSLVYKVCFNCLCFFILLSYVEIFRFKFCVFIYGIGILMFDNYFEFFYCVGIGINFLFVKEV